MMSKQMSMLSTQNSMLVEMNRGLFEIRDTVGRYRVVDQTTITWKVPGVSGKLVQKQFVLNSFCRKQATVIWRLRMPTWGGELTC